MFVGANSGQYSASRSGEYSFSRGMLRRTALLLAPSVAASSPPPKPCGFTKQDLMGLLKEAGYDATSPAYKAYFLRTGNPQETAAGTIAPTSTKTSTVAKSAVVPLPSTTRPPWRPVRRRLSRL